MAGNNKSPKRNMDSQAAIPTNPNAKQCVKDVMKFLAEITGDKVVAGQHTQTMAMEELYHIKKITGREPALLGFELLSYSPNINYFDTDEACMKEVEENYGTLQRAWEWAAKKGLITFTWHWFSPLGGRSKSFFSECTDFDADKALVTGTPEQAAMLSDMDAMAGILRPFNENNIPILWRPFHESEGEWFWWGAKGPETAKKLFRLMYERFTALHKLDNLIWVWNSPLPEGYPGDDVVDILSCDIYLEKHIHVSNADMYRKLQEIPGMPKITVIGENGCLPDLEAVRAEKAGWASFMTWSKDFCLTEEFNNFERLRELYHSPHAVTKENLPQLY